MASCDRQWLQLDTRRRKKRKKKGLHRKSDQRKGGLAQLREKVTMGVVLASAPQPQPRVVLVVSALGIELLDTSIQLTQACKGKHNTDGSQYTTASLLLRCSSEFQLSTGSKSLPRLAGFLRILASRTRGDKCGGRHGSDQDEVGKGPGEEHYHSPPRPVNGISDDDASNVGSPCLKEGFVGGCGLSSNRPSNRLSRRTWVIISGLEPASQPVPHHRVLPKILSKRPAPCLSLASQ